MLQTAPPAVRREWVEHDFGVAGHGTIKSAVPAVDSDVRLNAAS